MLETADKAPADQGDGTRFWLQRALEKVLSSSYLVYVCFMATILCVRVYIYIYTYIYIYICIHIYVYIYIYL